MKTEEKTCDERIEDQLESRLNRLLPDFDDMGLKELQSYADDLGISYDKDNDIDYLREHLQDESHDHILHDILSVDKTIVYDICLSTGGPADSIELHFQSQELIAGYYVYQDWFDGARRKLDDDVADQLANLFAVGPEFKS